MTKIIVASVLFSLHLYLCKEKVIEIPNLKISKDIAE